MQACVGVGAWIAAAGLACAQTTTEPPGSAVLKFMVFDPSANAGQGAWVQSMTAQPGQRVEWRMDVVYAGTRTDLFALGEAIYQPTIANADNIDGGDGVDMLGPWCETQFPCDFPPEVCYPLNRTNAAEGTPLSCYGKVDFGRNPSGGTGSNTLTVFRHSSGGNTAPPGEWIRIAGSSSTRWAGPLDFCPVPAPDLNLILRGVSSQQQSQALNSTYHIAGTSPIVFRQALLLSQRAEGRVVEIGTFPESQRRMGSTSSCDDRRYISWQTSSSDSGSHRTLYPTISPAFIFVTGSACDSIDFNRDTLFPDVQDIADFLTVFSGGACPTTACGDVDFNNDGLFPDTGDVESILSVFSGGPC